MAETRDQTRDEDAAKGQAGAFPSPSSTLQGRAGSFNSPSPPSSTLQGVGSKFPLSHETPLVLRSLSGLNPVPESSSTSPSTVEISGRSMSASSGRLSPTMTVAPANAELSLSNETVIFEQRLSERPEDIRDAARTISKAIADQIDLLNASKPNEGDALARHEDFIAFLRQIAERLGGLADALNAAVDASSEREPVLLGSAASITRSIGDFILEGLERHRSAIQACVVQVPTMFLSVLALQHVGVDPTKAFLGVGTLMGWKTISKDAGKK